MFSLSAILFGTTTEASADNAGCTGGCSQHQVCANNSCQPVTSDCEPCMSGYACFQKQCVFVPGGTSHWGPPPAAQPPAAQPPAQPPAAAQPPAPPPAAQTPPPPPVVQAPLPPPVRPRTPPPPRSPGASGAACSPESPCPNGQVCGVGKCMIPPPVQCKRICPRGTTCSASGECLAGGVPTHANAAPSTNKPAPPVVKKPLPPPTKAEELHRKL